MKERNRHHTMMHETALLSVFSVGMQGMGLLFNIFLTKRLGTASVGVLTLIGSFYSLAAVLSGGSGFIASSRFLSEELGCGGNPKRVFQFTLRFCMSLSIAAAVLLCLFAPVLRSLVSKADISALTIRLLSISLPISAVTACLKGRCYAYHRVFLPAVSECIEFLLRACVMAFCCVFLIPAGKITILTAFACSMIVGQGSAMLFLLMIRMPHSENSNICNFTFGRFLRLILPIMGNACLVSLLSSTNDALVPLTLLQYGSSTEEALSQFGSFEAIIIPTLFFPSVIQVCMSGLLVPELSRMRSEKDENGIRMLTERVLEQTMAYSLFIVLILMQFGRQIGMLLGGDDFTGRILCVMAPVVPCIYLEIILEGVLRGLGKQNFSSVNYLAEYVVRISVLLICVPLFGFYGIVASYIACNLTGNAVRLFFVLRLTGLKPVWKRILARPAFSLVLCWQLMSLLLFFLRTLNMPGLLLLILCVSACGILYWCVIRLLNDKRATLGAGNARLHSSAGNARLS